MTPDHHKRGGSAVAQMADLDPWEAMLVRSLRLWCEGPAGQSSVLEMFGEFTPHSDGGRTFEAFDDLMRTLVARSHRPLVRHDIGCSCVGADEAVFANLVRVASDGYHIDASLIATLMVGPGFAEHVALLAGQTGSDLRRPSAHRFEKKATHAPRSARLH